MAVYRELEKGEAAPVALWHRVFGVPEPFFTTLIDGGDASDNVSVAAFEGDQAVSSVHVFMRRIRDREGRPLKVGGIGSVSTHPDHRQKGHSGRLLEMAVAAMEREGCVWSFLGTGVNDHYARYGWRTVSTPDLWGKLRSDVEGEARLLTLNEATLDRMASLYEATTATRPMATVRSRQTWRTAVRYRLEADDAFAVGAFDGDRLATYVSVTNPWGKWAIADAAGEESRYPELLATVASQLRARGVERVYGLVPEDSPAMRAFGGIVESINLAESRSEMLRPIANRISWPDLFALYGDPRGRHCPLDAF